MRQKVDRLSKYIASQLEAIEGVEAITLHESAESDIHDPYFFLSLDIYYSGALPSPQQRQHFFEDAGGFESSEYTEKDRFFLEELPVRLEYKHLKRIDHIVDHPEENLHVFRSNGTYMFYRLYYGNVLYESSQWLVTTREKLEKLPDSFWKRLREAYFAASEHHLTDLKSAVACEDSLFYLLSLAGFMKNICSFLFAINRRFEPSGRRLFEQTLDLKVLPEDFRGHFYSIVREDRELPPSRKQEIAEKIVRSVMYMV
jgi:hypothetical protein